MWIESLLKTSALPLMIALSSCSTAPSIQVMQPVVNLPKLIVKTPVELTERCKPMILYTSNDARDVIKVTIKNHNLYYQCASKMKLAIMFIEK